MSDLICNCPINCNEAVMGITSSLSSPPQLSNYIESHSSFNSLWSNFTIFTLFHYISQNCFCFIDDFFDALFIIWNFHIIHVWGSFIKSPLNKDRNDPTMWQRVLSSPRLYRDWRESKLTLRTFSCGTQCMMKALGGATIKFYPLN